MSNQKFLCILTLIYPSICIFFIWPTALALAPGNFDTVPRSEMECTGVHTDSVMKRLRRKIPRRKRTRDSRLHIEENTYTGVFTSAGKYVAHRSDLKAIVLYITCFATATESLGHGDFSSICSKDCSKTIQKLRNEMQNRGGDRVYSRFNRCMPSWIRTVANVQTFAQLIQRTGILGWPAAPQGF